MPAILEVATWAFCIVFLAAVVLSILKKDYAMVRSVFLDIKGYYKGSNWVCPKKS